MGMLLAGLRELGQSARGVAVIDPAASAAELHNLNAQGVVGVRFNLVQSGATHEQMLEEVAALIQPFNWHLQIHLHTTDLLRLSERLIMLPVPVVIDHFARIHAGPSLPDEVAARVSQPLSTGKVWLKLSAPYIASPQTPAHEDLDGFVRRLVSERPDRLLWGSDWPHVTEPDKPDDAAMMNLLARWMSAADRQKMLVDNPAQLYRFAALAD